MNTDQSNAASPARRPNRRLRRLLAAAGFGFALFAFLQLDRSTVARFGSWAEGVHDAFHSEASAAARRFTADVKNLGGEPRVDVLKPGFLGVFGRSEHFYAAFRNKTFDDAALDRLYRAHGGRTLFLHLQNTSVTDAALGRLNGMRSPWQLLVENYP